MTFADGLRHKFGRTSNKKHVGASALQTDHLRIDRGFGNLVRLRNRLLAEVVLEFGFEGIQKIFSEIVVLIKYSNLGGWQRFRNIFRINPALAFIVRNSRGRIWVFLDVRELRRSRDDKEVGDLLCVQIFCRSGIGRSSQLAK
jgi:hypothetical protein